MKFLGEYSEMENKLVSVVIPTYNRKDVIMRAVSSVLNQTYTNLEVIVVDDGSTDDTVGLLKKIIDKRLIVIRSHENQGACHARNLGVEAASGYYIAFQDSDDEWMENKLAEQISFMEQKRIQVSFSPYILEDKGETAIIPANYKYADCFTNMKDILRGGNVIGLPTLIAQKSVLDHLEYVFSENLPCLQDYELAIRIVQDTAIGYYPIPLVRAYRMENCITNNMKKYVVAVRDIVMKHRQYVDVYKWMQNIVYYRFTMPDLAKLYDREMEWDFVPVEIQKIYRRTIIDEYDNYVLQRRNLYKTLWNLEIKYLENKKFAIYGTGVMAQRIYDELQKKALTPKFFLQTSVEDNGCFEDIDIIPVDECTERDITVIIGTSMKYVEEIFIQLKELNFHNIVIYDYM